MQSELQSPIAFAGVPEHVNVPKVIDKSVLLSSDDIRRFIAESEFGHIHPFTAELEENPSLDQLAKVMRRTNIAVMQYKVHKKQLASGGFGCARSHATRIVEQIATLCQDTQSPIHVQHWDTAHFHAFDSLWIGCLAHSPGDNSATFIRTLGNLYVAYAKARGQADATEGSPVISPIMPDILVEKIKILNKIHRCKKSELPGDLFTRILSEWTRVGLYWNPSWVNDDDDYSKSPPLTETIAKEVWRAASRDERRKFLPKLDLDWLPADVADTELRKMTGHEVARITGFSKMSDEQFFIALQKLLQASLNSYRTAGDNMLGMTRLSEFERRIQLEKPLREVRWDMPVRNWYNYCQGISFIANQQATPSKAQDLIHDHFTLLVTGTIASLQTLPSCPDDARILNHAFAVLACTAAAAADHLKDYPQHRGHGVTADPGEMAMWLRQLAPLLAAELPKFSCCNRMKDIFRTLDTVAGHQGHIIKSALLQSGLVSLEDLRRRDLTRRVLSATLNKYPERLVEIKKLPDFNYVAELFSIPVFIPETEKSADDSADDAQVADPIPDDKPSARKLKM